MKKSFYVIIILLLALSSARAEEDLFAKARKRMVEADLKGRDITDPAVLSVMGKVPRQLFVARELQKSAYNDHPLPIAEGQTISQPYIVAPHDAGLKIKAY